MMHRSHSTTRVADEYYWNSSSSVIGAPSSAASTAADDTHLPVYSPVSDVAKKEKSRLRSAENAVHIIPLILVLCAIILWFSSNPVDVVNKKHHSVVARDERLNAAGAFEIDGTQNHLHLDHPELEDVDLLHLHHHHHQKKYKSTV